MNDKKILYRLKYNTIIYDEYWEGKDLLENECPWLVPESIIKLDNIDMSDMNVLEFGSGGSTLFFAKRTKSVTSFETSKKWYNDVANAIKNKSLKNIEYNFYSSLNDNVLERLTKKHYDLILIDSDGNLPFNRENIVNLITQKINLNDTIIVLDNYNANYCGNLKNSIKQDKIEIYDDLHWSGKGTMIFYNEKYKNI